MFDSPIVVVNYLVCTQQIYMSFLHKNRVAIVWVFILLMRVRKRVAGFVTCPRLKMSGGCPFLGS